MRKMRWQKGLAAGMAVVTAMAMMAGCSSSGSTDTTAATQAAETTAVASDGAETSGEEESAAVDVSSQEPIRVGTMPHQMGVALYYADREGLFAEAGINVEVAMFQGGAAINEAIGAGELDGAISGLASVYALANNLVKMVGEVDTAGADGIVVRNDSDILQHKGEIEGKPDMYGSADTLRGKSFVCQVGQAQQFYISRWISQFGLTDEDITFINMEDASGYQAFLSGEGDVIGTKMPYIYELTQQEDSTCTIAAGVEDATGVEIKDCIIFTPQILEERRDDIKTFLSVIYDVIDQMEADQSFREQAIADFYQSTGTELVQEQLEYELTKNRLLTSEVQGSEDYYMGDGMQAVADFYGESGTIVPENVDNVYKNYDTSLLSEVLGVEVKAFSK